MNALWRMLNGWLDRQRTKEGKLRGRGQQYGSAQGTIKHTNHEAPEGRIGVRQIHAASGRPCICCDAKPPQLLNQYGPWQVQK